MNLLNLLLVGIVISLALAAAASPPALAAELAIAAYMTGRKLIQRMP